MNGCTSTGQVSFLLILSLLSLNILPFLEELSKLIYSELLKRLDDSQDSIRIVTCKTFASYLSKKGGCPTTLDSVHYEAIIKGISIHIDDTNPEIQQAVFESLCVGCSKNGGVLPDAVLYEVLSEARKNFRNVKYIDDVLSLIPSPSSSC